MSKLNWRARRGALTGLLTACGMLGLVSTADAATIHACVRSKTGATRIVGANAKCRRGEQKLSWNTTGPRGAAGSTGASGAAGAEGKAGASGQGPDFAAKQEGEQEGPGAAPAVEKLIPPGSYDVSANIVADARSSSPGIAEVLCVLTDTPGTEGTSGAEDIDLIGWDSGLLELSAGSFAAFAPLHLEGALVTKLTSRVGLACGDVGGKGGTLTLGSGHIQALQVTSIL